MGKCSELVKSVSWRFWVEKSSDYFQQFRYFSYQIISHGSDFKFHFVLVLLLENRGTKVQPSKTRRNNTSQCFAGEKKSFQPHSSSGFPAHFSVSAFSLMCEFGKWLNSFFKASSVLWLGSDLELLSGITDTTTRCNIIVITWHQVVSKDLYPGKAFL